MLRMRNAHLTKLLVMASVATAAIAITTSGTLAAAKCKQVKGKFSLQPVTAPACTSAIGICATGSYSCGLAGTSEFIGSSLLPTVDTPTTSVVILTGDNVIRTSDGTLMTKDAIVLQTTGAGQFAEVDTIVAGTDAWAGATGHITASGTFTAEAGGEAAYSGVVCTPQ